MRIWLLLALVTACGSNPPAVDGDGGVDVLVSSSRRLGMNDVTLLLPLPADSASPTLLPMTGSGGTELVPRALFTRLVTTPGDVFVTYEQFQLVAVRFDLCDRAAPGPCPATEDGRLRLVYQPVVLAAPGGGPTETLDVALHAFYPIPLADLPAVVDELRALSRIQNAPLDAALGVNPALAGTPPPDYATRLRALITTYASSDRLVRLTLFAQNAQAAAFNWALRGVELQAGAFVDIAIPAISATQQRAILTGPVGSTTYDTMPVADAPAGLATALSAPMFSAAASPARTQALEALVAVQNPLVHTATTVQCIACHTTTLLTVERAASAGVDPLSIAGRFTSSYNLALTTGVAQTEQTSLRALGWHASKPAISQRVINDTAEVLTEIEARFPAAP